jgi:type I restriction enzyme M protein
VLILKLLKNGGRSATIVPDGVLFGSSTAHKAVRKLLIDDNQLDAVISLPSGVFRPYAGVSTAILIFTKGGRTNRVFFYDIGADGFSLDDKRLPVQKNDLPDCLKMWLERDATEALDRTRKGFLVPADEIRNRDYDLSMNLFKETIYEEEQFDPPRVILERMRALETEIQRDLAELAETLK